MYFPIRSASCLRSHLAMNIETRVMPEEVFLDHSFNVGRSWIVDNRSCEEVVEERLRLFFLFAVFFARHQDFFERLDYSWIKLSS